jgi:hypothetical protein
MAKKKITPKKKSRGKPKTASKKKPMAKRKLSLRSRPARAKPKAMNKPVRRTPAATPELSSGSERSSLGSGGLRTAARAPETGLGEDAAGQSGDLQGLSGAEESNSESVGELLEEGQAFEAEVISGVENAPDPDEEEIHTHERPEDGLTPEEEEQ